MKVFDAIISLFIYVVGVFLIPMFAVNLARNPDDYWNWFGVVIWTYLMLSELVTIYVRKAVKEYDR